MVLPAAAASTWGALGDAGNLYFRVGRKQAVSKEKAAQMREYVRLHPGAMLAEIASACRLSCTIATVDNTLRRMGLTYKKGLLAIRNATKKGAGGGVGAFRIASNTRSFACKFLPFALRFTLVIAIRRNENPMESGN